MTVLDQPSLNTYSHIGTGPLECIHKALARGYANAPGSAYEVNAINMFGGAFVVMFRREYVSSMRGGIVTEYRVAIFDGNGRLNSDMIAA